MFDSDHRLLFMNMKFPGTNYGIKAELRKGRPKLRRKRRDHNVLRDYDETRLELTERLEHNLIHLNECDLSVDVQCT